MRVSPKYWPLRTWLDEFARASGEGAPVPSERALAERFGLSRTSVRRAIRELIVEGRLRAVRGSGTFVAPPKVRYRMRLTSYTEEMRAQGIAASGRLLMAGEEPAGALAGGLGIRESDAVVRIVRLRTADEEPIAIDESVFPAGLVPGLATRLGGDVSVTEVLERDYGLRAERAEETMEASVADPESAGLLAVEPGLPLLLLTRRAFLSDGTPLERARSLLRGDRAVVVADLRRDADDTGGVDG